MIAIAAVLMTVAFPGAYFPAIGNKSKVGSDDDKEALQLSGEELRTITPGSSKV